MTNFDFKVHFTLSLAGHLFPLCVPKAAAGFFILEFSVKEGIAN